MMEQPVAASPQLSLEPKSIKVFGILHVIFGALGILGAVVGWVVVLFWRPMLTGFFGLLMQDAGDPEPLKTAMGFIEEFFGKLQGYMVVSTFLNSILVVMLFVAGLRLLKMAHFGRVLSNWWAWGTVAMVLVGIVLQYTYMAPAQAELEEKLLEMSGYAGSASARGPEQVIGEIFGVVVGTVVGVAYAGLSLYFLNRPVVRDFFQQR
ncbi:MAG: hypothetical protein AAGC74_12670 [Verrucomicrobiota bacterium]